MENLCPSIFSYNSFLLDCLEVRRPLLLVKTACRNTPGPNLMYLPVSRGTKSPVWISPSTNSQSHIQFKFRYLLVQHPRIQTNSAQLHPSWKHSEGRAELGSIPRHWCINRNLRTVLQQKEKHLQILLMYLTAGSKELPRDLLILRSLGISLHS